MSTYIDNKGLKGKAFWCKIKQEYVLLYKHEIKTYGRKNMAKKKRDFWDDVDEEVEVSDKHQKEK